MARSKRAKPASGEQRSLFAVDEASVWEQADSDDLLIAEVAFNRPVDKVFDYLIPDRLRDAIVPGQRVRAPFGRGDRPTTGFVTAVRRPQRPVAGLKALAETLDPQPLLSPHMLELTRWIANRYLCAWGQVLNAVVPAGVKSQAGTREVLLLEPAPMSESTEPPPKLTEKQLAILAALHNAGRPLRLEELMRIAKSGPGPITTLRRRKLILARVERTEATALLESPLSNPGLQLNAEQQVALDAILTAVRTNTHRVQLLYGVTGSGKTEVYIRTIEEVVAFGRQAIVLVPEISLTPQTIRRFRSRFSRVAVLHSHQSDAERHRHWRDIAAGRVQVVVGARSAVFAPTPHLGLIVIDEEHENSFKQETVPRYHARDVAAHRAEMLNVPLLLGSATPSLETWSRTEAGRYDLLRLMKRAAGRAMPPVSVVDTSHDPFIQSGGAIGRALRTAIQTALEAGGQIILFLNVRGYSPVLFCRACGMAVKCPHCDVSLTWHKDRKKALCHACDYETLPPSNCPKCSRSGLQYVGVGTQRLEAEVKSRFPGFTIARMDSDSMRKPGSHDRTLEAFRTGAIRILLGTQMIGKGLDFPNVTLVGVVDADTVLHQPDFRSAERTFQLVAQVAGRTGRGPQGGRVIVQTACPDEPSIRLAAMHDYDRFAAGELAHRREFRYPPTVHQVRVILRGAVEADVEAAARSLSEVLKKEIQSSGIEVGVLGPAPAPVARLQTLFRYHFVLTAHEIPALLQTWRAAAELFPRLSGVEFAVDVEPINMR